MNSQLSKGNYWFGTYISEKPIGIECVMGFVDADFVHDITKRRSMIGYVFTLYGNVISWKSNLQVVVSLSKIEAEYIGYMQVHFNVNLRPLYIGLIYVKLLIFFSH